MGQSTLDRLDEEYAEGDYEEGTDKDKVDREVVLLLTWGND